MTLTIVGELTADQSTLVLLGLGPDHELAEATRLLQTVTPLCKPSDPPGAMTVPASWPAVVQLANLFGAAWRPGPALSAWTTAQVGRRLGPRAELAVAPPRDFEPYSHQIAAACMIGAVGSALLFDDPGPQPVTTPILTPFGWTELGKLAPGDLVYNLYGEEARVRAVKHFGEQPVYRVTLNDRTSTLATAEHRWRVYTFNDRKRQNGGRVLNTRQMLDAGLRVGGQSHFYLPQQPVLRGYRASRSSLPMPPYGYGALLGDGSLGSTTITLTCPDDEVLSQVERDAAQLGTTFRRDRPEGRCMSTAFHRDGRLREALGELGALVGAGQKHVDPRYLQADEYERRWVLAGLLDTDGTVIRTGAGVEFSSASSQLAQDAAFLARSLGAVATESDPQPAGYRGADGKRVECLPKHRVLMRFPADGPNPFWLRRKADAWAAAAAKVQRRNPPRTIQAIEPEGVAEVCCIELDTDVEDMRVYLTDTALIPTHNTGKTASAVLGLVERHAAGYPVHPVVIVAPPAVVDSWLQHLRWLAPTWRVLAWRGSPKRRRKLSGAADVYVTSYGTARMDAGEADLRRSPLLALRPRTVVADEVHKLKAQATEQSKAVRRLARHASAFIGLSGTPITHHPGDLWPALYAMEPEAYPSRERWIARYCRTVQGDYTAQVLGLNELMEPEFRQTLLGQYRRVSKADVLAELPPKVYSVRQVELPGPYRKAYDQMEQDMLAELPDGGELSAMGVLAQMTRLSQLASAAADVEVTHETVDGPDGLPMIKRHTAVTLKAPSWKVDELLEILAERPGKQTIVAAPSRQLMMLAGAAAQAKGYRVGYVVGGQSPSERTANVDAFQAGETDLICVTTAAGGVGLTLTAASTVVFLQRPWSLVDALQMEDRAHRIGSEIHESIEVIDVVATKTIESRVRNVLVDRADQLAKLVEDPRIVRELLGGAEVRDLRRRSQTTGAAPIEGAA